MKVYLAGPEVFLPNAREILDEKIALTREAGFVPVSPGDLEIPRMPTPLTQGLEISRIDEQLMSSADAIIANLTPYRGIAADTGTVFELGFMSGRGKVAFAYTNVRADFHTRIRDWYGAPLVEDATGRLRGPDGLSVENFGMIDNLMLDGGVLARGGSVIVGNAAPERLYTDMAAFRMVLSVAAKRLLA